MKRMRPLILSIVLLSGCKDNDAFKAKRDTLATEALKEAGAGAQLIAVCGPFHLRKNTPAQAIELPSSGKFIAITSTKDGDVKIQNPFVLTSNPPAPKDSLFAAVGRDGKALPQSDHFHNTGLSSGDKSPVGERDSYDVWALDARGAPSNTGGENFKLVKGVGRPTRITAFVNVPPAKGVFEADCN